MEEVRVRKKLFIFLFVGVVVFGSIAFADAFRLWGYVKYENGQGVGSNKPVHVYTSTTTYTTVYTDGSSQYSYGFEGSQYFEKVVCIFSSGGKWYQGTTVIQDTLDSDTQKDITVSEVQNPEEE